MCSYMCVHARVVNMCVRLCMCVCTCLAHVYQDGRTSSAPPHAYICLCMHCARRFTHTYIHPDEAVQSAGDLVLIFDPGSAQT